MDLDETARRPSLTAVVSRLGALGAPADAVPRVANSRAAAVLVPLYEREDQTRVLLTRRPDTMPTHQGEVSFPGGGHEPGVDEDLRATALRETSEELGIAATEIEVVRRLDGIATVGSRFTITPFVGVLGPEPQLAPDEREVERIIDLSLADLLHPDAFHSEVWGRIPGEDDDFVVSFFELPGETIWGATARILADFLTRVVG